MNTTTAEIMRFVRDNDVKFIRLSFCNPFGVQKNISILAEALESAFKNGVYFDASSVAGFEYYTASDLLLFPDPTTMTMLPWRPDPGSVIRFYCDIKTSDGRDFEMDSRYILKKVLKRCSNMGYTCNIGTECEFYLFLTDDSGKPSYDTLDYGGCFDISPLDKGENIRREICLCLETMGLSPKTSYHEKGPGQNEIDFTKSDAQSSADNLLTFKSVVRAIAARNGLYASFMAKPLPHQNGSGLHINISLSKEGKNVFCSGTDSQTDVAGSFIAGVLEKSPEMTLFLNPNINSYKRLGSFSVPRYVSWSSNNGAQLIRVPKADPESARMELRSPDPTTNPYLAFALIISAGLDGIERGLSLPSAIDSDLRNASDDITSKLSALPCDLSQAIAVAGESDFIKNIVGEQFFTHYVNMKNEELSAFKNFEDEQEFYTQRYFKYL